MYLKPYTLTILKVENTFYFRFKFVETNTILQYGRRIGGYGRDTEQ